MFLSFFWSELFRLHGTQLKMSTAYHPETDGQREALNKCLETYLRRFCSEQPKNWALRLHWASTGTTLLTKLQQVCHPLKVVYGHKPPGLIQFLPGETVVAAVSHALIDWDEFLRQLKHNLERAQQHMKTSE